VLDCNGEEFSPYTGRKIIARRFLIVLLILPFLPSPQGIDRSFLNHISSWFEALSTESGLEDPGSQVIKQTAYDHLQLASSESPELPIDFIEDSLNKEKEVEEEEEKEKECRENNDPESEFVAVWWAFSSSDHHVDIWHEREIHFHINYSISGHFILRC
jgi:hypothetical protein